MATAPAAAFKPPGGGSIELLSATFFVSMFVLAILVFAIVIAWQTKSEALIPLLTLAGSNATIAVGFWLGSSTGSRNKDQTLSNITNNLTSPSNTP